MNRQYRHSMNSNHVTPSGDIPALSTSPSDPSSIIRHPLSIPPTSSLVLLDDPALHPSGIIPTLQNVVSKCYGILYIHILQLLYFIFLNI